ncbi:thioesterase II family protein [Streptomyces mirabilis]
MFHHAGGSHLLYRGWAAHFQEDWEVCLLDAPGRGQLQALPLIDDCDALVAYFHEALTPWLNRPFAFFGHSMGSLVAYELTRRMVREGGPVPAWLGISAYGAPHGTAGADGRRHLLPDDELRDWLRNAGGSPPKLLDNDAVWRKFGPVFRGDFKLVDTWEPPRNPAPLPVPVQVFGGRDDTLMGPERLLEWRAFTEDFRGLTLYDGGHFYLAEHRVAVARTIMDAVP